MSAREESADRKDLRVLAGLWPFVRPHAVRLGAALALLPAITAASIAGTLAVKQALDLAIVPRGDARPLVGFLIAIVSLLALESALRFVHAYLLQSAGQLVMHDLRCAVMDHLQRVGMAYLDGNPVGRLLTRATGDLEAIGELFSSGAVGLVGDSITIAGITGTMLWLDAPMAAVVLALSPLLGSLLWWYRKRLRALYETTRSCVARMAAYLAEAIAGTEVVKTCVAEERVAAEYGQINREYRDAYWWSNVMEAGLYSTVELFGHLTVAALVLAGGRGIVAGRASFGTLVAFLRYAEDLYGPLREASARFATLQGAIVASSRVLAVLAVAPEPDDPGDSPGPGTDRPAAGEIRRGAVEFDSVTFAYRPGHPVLHDLSLAIRPGERVAIVGPTGAGKSTVVKLLMRLYEGASESIRLDGVPLGRWPLERLRREIAFLPQDPYLFAGTFEENIGLGREPPERIRAAGSAVGLDPVVARAGGYGGALAERGSNLSAGERQLVSLARVMLADPGVVVLDEATSSVDTFTEELVADSLDRVMRGRTVIIIAHRLATVRTADRILVLAGGRLREQGTHEELLAAGGLFARLHELQFTPGPGR